MLLNDVGTLWAKYQSAKIDYTIHPNTSIPKVHGMDGYRHCGKDAIRAIVSVLPLSPTSSIKTALDFGSGYGRVARHLRALLPEAALHFSDTNVESADFCADQFNGLSVKTDTDLSKLSLPGNYDLIWVGSVFTHLDLQRMIILHDTLINALAPKGLLVATFHGRAAIAMQESGQPLINPTRWKSIRRGYDDFGIGYEEYENMPGWGVSASTPVAVLSLGKNNPKSRIVSYTESGWVGFHDVASWYRA